MRFRSVLVALTALTAISSATPATAQSIGRQMDLLKLEQQAAETISALVDSDFKACETKLTDLRTIMNDPRFDRMRAEVRRPFLFSVILCAEIKDRPLGLAAARKLEPIAVEPMEIGAVQTIQISDALERDAMADATRRFLKLMDAQPEVVAGWRPGMINAFTDYLDDDPDLALTALQRITSFAWTDPESRAPVRELMSSLRALARYDEAIQVGEAFRARLQDGEEFQDREEQGDWILILLGHSYLDTGKVKEAEAAFDEAIGASDDAEPSTDARINWAGRLLDLARPRSEERR